MDLRDKVFVFTGALPGMTRAQATEFVRAAGGIVRDNVSRQTDFVVAGEGAGAKLTEAGRLGVKVINAEEFRAMMGVE
jgi:DNA ligase (NAD+)